ncbi:MAG: sulfate adenylyltransferase, partial [Candidatus Aminicenantes bacterium]|nr:sulfate adenylyltransferase [Candidatus Aminicenantes bacterium]
MIQPHGGKLVNRVLQGDEKEKALEKAQLLPSLKLNFELVSDVENITFGVFSPLEGFMTQREYQNVLNHMRLPNDLPWPIPIILDAERGEADKLNI